MDQPPPAETITVDRRRAAFRALVEDQDAGVSVAASRTDVARRFALTEDEVRAIEQEGIEAQWPPLG